MQKDAIEKLFSIALKVRLFREWQASKTASEKEFSERELITLELIEAFPKIDITEKKLSIIFGLSPSSINDIIKRLTESGLLEKEADEEDITRGRALHLTKKGTEQLKKFKVSGAARYAYLFSLINDDEWDSLGKLLDKVDDSTTDAIKKNIFDIWA